MSILLRKFPFLGLIVAVVFIPNLDGLLIRNDTIIITFHIGGMAAKLSFDLRRLERYAVSLFCLLLLICVLVVVMNAGRPVWLPLLAPFIIWPVASLFVGTPSGR